MNVAQQRKAKRMLKAMRRVAEIGSVMLDGEEAKTIIEERSYYHIANPHPKFRFLAGDYFDVDAARFLRMKKSMQRLVLLLPFPASTTLWVAVKGREGYITTALRNGTLRRAWSDGKMMGEAQGAMAEALNEGRIVVLEPLGEKDQLTVLAPLFDSLGDVAGVLELAAQL